MEHAQTGIRPRAVLFDLLTGLIDSWTLWADVAGAGDGRRWREAYLRKTYAEAAYRAYADLVREAAVDTGLLAAFADRLVSRYGELEPWPEVGEVLGRLAEDVPLGVVTNCSEAVGQLAASRIDIAFRAIITAERAGFYKPHPRPYRLALETLGMRPDECLFVAGSAYDLTGAGSVGLPVFWHDRIGMTAPQARRPRSAGTTRSFRCFQWCSVDQLLNRFAPTGGALDHINSVPQASWRNRDELEAEAAIGLFVHSFESQGLLTRLADTTRT